MSDVENLGHILEGCRRVREYTQYGRKLFDSDRMTQDAVVFNLEVIGEAVEHLSQSFRTELAFILGMWMADFRDKLNQNYFEVQVGLVWDVVEKHLPPLMEQVALIRAKLSASPQNTSQDHPDPTDEMPT